jgi:hypothetical protein
MADSLRLAIEKNRQFWEQKFAHGSVGTDWFHLSEPEEKVYGIDRARWPRMLAAWECYEALIDIVEPSHYDEAMIRAERKNWPKLRTGETDVRVFMDFSVAKAGLTEKEAHAIFYKIEFWKVRAGLMFGARG